LLLLLAMMMMNSTTSRCQELDSFIRLAVIDERVACGIVISL
jgi:hypothetical protein